MFTFIFHLLLAAGALTFNGLALSILWRWFAVPLLHLPPLSLAGAIGVSLVVSFLTHQYSREEPAETEKQKRERRVHVAAYCILRPLFLLAAGALVRLWL